MSYTPLPPFAGKDPAKYAFEELQDLARALAEAQELAMLQVLHVEPIRLRDGMIVYADGTDWDPGSGEGFYGRQAGAWVKL